MLKVMTKSRLLTATLALIVSGLSWFPYLDEYSSGYVDSAIADAGVIYGTARGINALVSVAQGTELALPGLTVTIGEVLDPVNDLVERFSAVMTWALASLALQKILLVMISHTSFTVLLSAAGLLLVAACFAKSQRNLSLALRTFLAVVFIRFSLALVVLTNSWVDTLFLEDSLSPEHEKMRGFQGVLQELNNLSQGLGPEQEEIENLEYSADVLQRAVDELSTLHKQKLLDITVLDSQLDVLLRKKSWLKRLNPFSRKDQQAVELKRQIATLQQNADELDNRLDSTSDLLEERHRELSCLYLEAQGERCRMLELPSREKLQIRITAKLQALEEQVSVFASNAISVLMSVLLKSLLFPLLFFFAVLKGCKLIWRSELFQRQ
jgi:signal transduction histidine kinase